MCFGVFWWKLSMILLCTNLTYVSFGYLCFCVINCSCWVYGVWVSGFKLALLAISRSLNLDRDVELLLTTCCGYASVTTQSHTVYILLTCWLDFRHVGSTSCSSSRLVVVVDLYSASHSAFNALLSLLRCKKMSFQSRSEAVVHPAGCRRESGSEFHSTRPTMEKVRRPNVLRRCRGTINCRWFADLRRWRLETSDVILWRGEYKAIIDKCRWQWFSGYHKYMCEYSQPRITDFMRKPALTAVSAFFHENHCSMQLWVQAAYFLQCLGRLSLPLSVGLLYVFFSCLFRLPCCIVAFPRLVCESTSPRIDRHEVDLSANSPDTKKTAFVVYSRTVHGQFGDY